MKNPIIIGIMGFSILLAGCGKKSVADKDAPPYHGQTFTKASDDDFIAQEQKVADTCKVIAYASADTNHLPDVVFIVSEIWKGGYDASALGVTNGLQFSQRLGATYHGALPDGAVVLIPQSDSPSAALEKRRLTFIRSGRVLDMTIKEYKTRLGI